MKESHQIAELDEAVRHEPTAWLAGYRSALRDTPKPKPAEIPDVVWRLALCGVVSVAAGAVAVVYVLALALFGGV